MAEQQSLVMMFIEWLNKEKSIHEALYLSDSGAAAYDRCRDRHG
jgi:hypothetical protein